MRAVGHISVDGDSAETTAEVFAETAHHGEITTRNLLCDFHMIPPEALRFNVLFHFPVAGEEVLRT